MPRSLPDVSKVGRIAPIAAWMHWHQFTSRPTIAITFPGTTRAVSIPVEHLSRVRRALEAAEARIAAAKAPFGSVDLLKGIRDE